MTCIALALFSICAMLVVDLTLLYGQRREQQGATDLAAIVAANNIGKHDELARSILDITERAFDATNNGGASQDNAANLRKKSDSWYQAAVGRYVDEPAIPVEDRFIPGGQPKNAVEVKLYAAGKTLFLGNFIRPPMIRSEALAARRAEATFSVASPVSPVDHRILNSVLSSLAVAKIGLDATDYELLAKSRVSLVDFVNALANLMNVPDGEYIRVIGGHPTIGQAIEALISATKDAAAAAVLQNVRAAVARSDIEIDLGRIIDLGRFNGSIVGNDQLQEFRSPVGALDLLMTIALSANGARLADIDLSEAAPGLSSITAKVAVGQFVHSAPWLRIGEGGEFISNTQLQIAIDSRMNGGGALAGIEIRLPIYLEIGRAEAELQRIICDPANPTSASVVLAARSATVAGYIGESDPSQRNFGGPQITDAKVASTRDLTAYAHSNGVYLQSKDQLIEFSGAEVAGLVAKTARASSNSRNLVSGLVADADLILVVNSPGSNQKGVTESDFAAAINSMALQIDSATASLLGAFGTAIGESAFRINEAQCSPAAVVR